MLLTNGFGNVQNKFSNLGAIMRLHPCMPRLPVRARVSSLAEEPAADEDDGLGVRGRRRHDPPEPVPEPPSGAEAHDLPIVEVEDEEGR